jgi:hypothetical protein
MRSGRRHLRLRMYVNQPFEVSLLTSMHDGGVEVGEPMRDLDRDVKNLCGQDGEDRRIIYLPVSRFWVCRPPIPKMMRRHHLMRNAFTHF